MSDLEIELREIVNNYQENHLPVTLAAKDVSHRYNISLAQVYLMIDQLLHEDDDTHMSFTGNSDVPRDYVKRRWKGEV